MRLRSLIFLLLFCHPVIAGEPEDVRVKWLQQHAIPFATVEPGQGSEDLQALKQLIGNARIVSLGEATHGSREIFQMKHRLVEYLATELGFTLFSIEASMPESFRVSDYVVRKTGDPATLIRGMYFWTWNTEEVLAMVEWMRQFNEQGKGPIQFTGFDMQTPDVAVQIVLQFLAAADAELHAHAKESYDQALKARRGSLGAPFGVATGSFPVGQAQGTRVTFSGWIRTDDLKDGHAGLWWRADGPKGKVLAFDNMQSKQIRGTRDWERHSIALEVPEETVNINFGVLMAGKGKAWFDGLEVELDGKPFRDADFDFDFESKVLKGLMAMSGGRYPATLDDQVFKSGKQSLRLEYRPAVQRGGISADEAHERCRDVLRQMEDREQRFVEELDAEDARWAIQNARVVAQCMELRSGKPMVRDRSMAENIAWILRQHPEAKIVLWAHNGHVAKRRFAMGKYLDEKFGDQHLAIGFATAKGKYQAIGDGGLGQHKLQSPPSDSVEHLFLQADMPRFILDLRHVKADSVDSGWLAQPKAFRSIGALAMDRQFSPHNLAELFDAVIYIEETTSARPIKR